MQGIETILRRLSIPQLGVHGQEPILILDGNLALVLCLLNHRIVLRIVPLRLLMLPLHLHLVVKALLHTHFRHVPLLQILLLRGLLRTNVVHPATHHLPLVHAPDQHRLLLRIHRPPRLVRLRPPFLPHRLPKALPNPRLRLELHGRRASLHPFRNSQRMLTARRE